MAWLLLAIAAYGVFLITTAPVRIVERLVVLPPVVSHLSGTVWDGEAVLGDALLVGWEVDPAGSMTTGRVRLNWTLAGGDTRLSGAASIDRHGAVMVTAVSGVAGWSLVETALGGAPFTCDPSARVEIAEIALAQDRIHADGELTSAPGHCSDATQAPPVAVPALHARVETDPEGVRLAVRLRETPQTLLGEAVVTGEGILVMTIHPAGAALVPGMPSSAATVIEMPLAVKAPPPPDR